MQPKILVATQLSKLANRVNDSGADAASRGYNEERQTTIVAIRSRA